MAKDFGSTNLQTITKAFQHTPGRSFKLVTWIFHALVKIAYGLIFAASYIAGFPFHLSVFALQDFISLLPFLCQLQSFLLHLTFSITTNKTIELRFE